MPPNNIVVSFFIQIILTLILIDKPNKQRVGGWPNELNKPIIKPRLHFIESSLFELTNQLSAINGCHQFRVKQGRRVLKEKAGKQLLEQG